MTRSQTRTAKQCHALNFFYDDEDGCALTIFLNGVRFHIIAEAKRLKSASKSGKSAYDEYSRLLSAMRDEVEQEEDPEAYQRRKDLEATDAELHNTEDDRANGDSANTTHESQDSGLGHNEDDDATEVEDNGSDSDSAVDVSEAKQNPKEVGVRDSGVVLGDRYAPESEKKLQKWMLSPFGEIFDDLAPVSHAPKNQTLEEWYHGKAYFFTLDVKNDQLSATREETADDLEKGISDLVPRMPLPKYIKDLNIPLVQAKDIIVLTEGTEPAPYHPIRVKVNDQVQFLKMVDMSQFQPTKREIQLLKDIEKKGVHEKIRVPQILGLVYENSKSEIMGFLQTDIEDPTPLTKMLDSDVVEDKRQKWAKESERMVKILHDHGIIWGDAKADNFMVDKHGDLWIIDFGGSYTDGWVDPELMETKEGDEMGVEKIVNALEDPEANTFEPGEDTEDKKEKEKNTESKAKAKDKAEAEKESKAVPDAEGTTISKKRSRDEDEDEDNTTDDNSSPSKKRK